MTKRRHRRTEALPDTKGPSGGAVTRYHSVQMSSLTEVTVDSLNGIEEDVAEWEEIEFLVQWYRNHSDWT